jgi:hypothetical protein
MFKRLAFVTLFITYVIVAGCIEIKNFEAMESATQSYSENFQ